MLEKTEGATLTTSADRPLIVRRIDAVPIALPLKSPMKMSCIRIATPENLLVRIEGQDSPVGWTEAPPAPNMTGDTLRRQLAAARDHLAPLLIGKDANADHQ